MGRLSDLHDQDTFSDIKISYFPPVRNSRKLPPDNHSSSGSSSIFSVEFVRKLADDSDLHETALEIRNSQALTQAVLSLDETGIWARNTRTGGHLRIEKF